MLELVAFVAGASIMAIEIVASRILAPVLGNSMVVWSSLIGVIPAELSYGYLKGGVLADRNASAGQPHPGHSHCGRIMLFDSVPGDNSFSKLQS